MPKGGCTDRFAQAVFKKEKIEPAAYLNQNIEVITSNFRAGKIDARGHLGADRLAAGARKASRARIASGASVDENDAAILAARYDLIKQRPDVIKGWLNAELDAELYLADPKNAMRGREDGRRADDGLQREGHVDVAVRRVSAEPKAAIPYATPIRSRSRLPRLELINRASAFLHSIKSINVEKLRPDAVMPEFTEEILKERKLTPPIAQIKGRPESDFK